MMGTINCIYETPCGWCSKWDKECDKKIAARGNRAKCNSVDDAVGNDIKEYIGEVLVNKMCESESDHEWECVGMSTAGTLYRCKKCYATKTIPINSKPLSITI